MWKVCVSSCECFCLFVYLFSFLQFVVLLHREWYNFIHLSFSMTICHHKDSIQKAGTTKHFSAPVIYYTSEIPWIYDTLTIARWNKTLPTLITNMTTVWCNSSNVKVLWPLGLIVHNGQNESYTYPHEKALPGSFLEDKSCISYSHCSVTNDGCPK